MCSSSSIVVIVAAVAMLTLFNDSDSRCKIVEVMIVLALRYLCVIVAAALSPRERTRLQGIRQEESSYKKKLKIELSTTKFNAT